MYYNLVHPLAAIGCTAHARYFVRIIFNVEFVVVR